MRKILIILISLVLFVISYQVRSDFLATRDYNNPSDAHEYIGAAQGVKFAIDNLLSGRILSELEVREIIGSLNTHGAPLYIAYLVGLLSFNLSFDTVTPIVSAFLPVVIFLAGLFFVPLWIALLIGFITSFYTPIFGFIFSSMPEGFTAAIVPLLVITVSLLVNRGKKSAIFFLAGVLLAFVGFARHVFTYYGFFFILIWYFIAPKNKRIKQAVLLFVGYLSFMLLWQIVVWWSGTSPYPHNSVLGQFYDAFNLETQGWTMGYRISDISWWKIISLILGQNLFSQIALRLERIVLFLQNPAIAYATVFPLPLIGLKILHTLVLLFAFFGLRIAFKNKTILLLTTAVIWNSIFCSIYVIEELRLQLPVAGLVILLSGVGFKDFLKLLKNKETRSAIISISFLALIWFIVGKNLMAIEINFFPFIENANFWFFINALISIIIIILAGKKLWTHDQKDKAIIEHKWFKRAPSMIPLIGFVMFLVSFLRNPSWHQWYAPLAVGQRVEQVITLGESTLKDLRHKKGYILIDIQDPNAAQNISVFLNNVVLDRRLSMRKSYSPVDLNAIRQWQTNWPRLGYGQAEENVALSAAWPNMRQWLVIPVSGLALKQKNKVTVRNSNYLTSEYPLIFGDFPPYGSGKYYEGPTTGIFQGMHAYNKYQVDNDFRLNQTRRLHSIDNSSIFFLNNEEENKDDLSVGYGKQTGRYRIFFLFPYISGDPVDIF